MPDFENKIFSGLQAGDAAELTRSLSQQDADLLTAGAESMAPVHGAAAGAETGAFDKVIVHGMRGRALLSALIGTGMPGPNVIYHNPSLEFLKPAAAGDRVTVSVRVREKRADNTRALLDFACVNASGDVIVRGAAEAAVPGGLPPALHVHERGASYKALIDAATKLAPLRVAVVHPCDAISIGGALEAMDEGLIVPVLIGPEAKIRAAAAEAGRDLGRLTIVDTPHSHAAAERAVELARRAEVEALMKGKLHTDELMAAVVDKAGGLRTERRMSHVYALDVPHYPKPLFITDAAINIYPDLETKRDIVQNAIELAQALGIATPKVALLSAVETVSPKITSTIDAAALCKMADRGQIAGGLLDGPLAFDNAISKQAAEAKGIVSPVAGEADILLAPDLEAGNMLAKQLIYLAGADAAGIVLGARIPIILTSRADGMMARLASCAVAQIFVRRRKGAGS